MLFPIREWFETEKSKKDADWANRVIRFIRMNKQPLVSYAEAERGMAYLLGCQDLSFIRQLFQNPTAINLNNENAPRATQLVNGFGQPITPHSQHNEFLQKEMNSVDFKPLPYMEKLRNVIAAEMKKMGVVLNVRSEDPTSTSKRIKDKAFLEKKSEIEGMINYIYTSIGQQPYRVKQNVDRFGEKPDNGNTAQFEEMWLNGGDPTDVSFFMDNFHKLDEEIAAESPINFVMTYNQVTLDFEKYLNDSMAKKAVALVNYVSDVTGAQIIKYLAPETVYIYGGGNRQDFNDANAKFYERKVTIKEMLDMFGNAFDMEHQFNNLLMAVTNTTSTIEFTGNQPSWKNFASGNNNIAGNNNKFYNYNEFMSFKVTVGYIEFNSQNQETFGQVLEDASFYENNQSPDGKYPTKARWETPTYRAFYLAISEVDQIMFKFGELPYQDIEGASDVSVNFTIKTWKEIGDPISIMVAPLLDIMNEAWFKFRYELRRAKPRGRGWNYDSMISTMMDLIPDTNTTSFNKLQKVMEMLDGSANEIYTFPTIEGKPVLLPGNQLNYDIPNGLSKESMHWWEIIMSVGQYIADLVGWAPLRQGDPGPDRSSMNNQFKALEYSQAATYYVPDMLMHLFQQTATQTCFFTQDIITYKTHNTLAYKWLEDGIGVDTLDKIEKLGKKAMHRFGIFVESLNQGPLRQKLDASLFEAVKNGKIHPAEELLINDIKSPKKAYITFAYFEQRNRKLAEQAQQSQQKAQTDGLLQIEQEKQKTIQIEGQYMLAGKRIDAESNQNAHLISQQGQIDRTAMKIKGDTEQIYHDAIADLQKQMALLNNTGKTTDPLPAPPPLASLNNAGSAPTQGNQGADQLEQSVQPQYSESGTM